MRILVITLLFALFVCSQFGMQASGQVPESKRSKKAVTSVTPTLQSELSAKGLSLGKPLFIQITKIPAELRVFVERSDGTYQLFKTYPICRYSGGLGPKKKEGDGKSPEGFYTIKANQMNPSSSYHLSFNLGFPNSLDRQSGYTGSYLMVHGRCVSIGCYAMTDPAIEEIWSLMVAAFHNGQREIPVHIFPFRMNWPMREIYQNHPEYSFWRMLIPAWQAFSDTKIPPIITVAQGQYVVTARSQP